MRTLPCRGTVGRQVASQTVREAPCIQCFRMKQEVLLKEQFGDPLGSFASSHTGCNYLHRAVLLILVHGYQMPPGLIPKCCNCFCGRPSSKPCCSSAILCMVLVPPQLSHGSRQTVCTPLSPNTAHACLGCACAEAKPETTHAPSSACQRGLLGRGRRHPPSLRGSALNLQVLHVTRVPRSVQATLPRA